MSIVAGPLIRLILAVAHLRPTEHSQLVNAEMADDLSGLH